MTSNAHLDALLQHPEDPMSAMYADPEMMLVMYREIARVTGSEIVNGPVPEGSTAETVGQVGRGVRRSGTALRASAGTSASNTMKFGGHVSQGMAYASRVGRPNMRRLLQLTAFRAHQVAMAANRGELEDEELRKKRIKAEHKLMKRHAAQIAAMGAAAHLGVEGSTGLIQSVRNMNRHSVAQMLIERAFSPLAITSTVTNIATKPIEAGEKLISRMMGRDPEAASMSLETPTLKMSTKDGVKPKRAPEPGTELAIDTPAPAPAVPSRLVM
jgi:hypothetical protein